MGGLTLDEHMMRRGLEIHAKANERERPTDAAKRLRRAIREKRAARPTKKPVDQIIRDELRQKKREARAERRRARGLDDDDASSVSSFASVASSSAASSCSFVPSEAAGPRRGTDCGQRAALGTGGQGAAVHPLADLERDCPG